MDEKDELKKQLEEELEWVKYRLSFLDIIDKKLLEMKVIADKALDETLSLEEREKLNIRINQLAIQVKALDEESKNIFDL